jgi:hypothetical protein
MVEPQRTDFRAVLASLSARYAVTSSHQAHIVTPYSSCTVAATLAAVLAPDQTADVAVTSDIRTLNGSIRWYRGDIANSSAFRDAACCLLVISRRFRSGLTRFGRAGSTIIF